MTFPIKQSTQQDISTRVVIVTMDTHLNSAVDRARVGLKRLLPQLSLTIHSASEFAGNPEHLAQCRKDIAQGDIIIVTMLFLEDHFLPLMDALKARREGQEMVFQKQHGDDNDVTLGNIFTALR